MGGAPEGITSLEAASVRPKAREIEPRSNPVTGSGGERPERAAEGGERVAARAVRDGEHDALEAATPLQCVEHITP